MKKVNELKEFKKNSSLFFLALPAVIFIFIFNYIPLYGLVLPFKNFKYDLGFLKSPWTGLENFKFLFTSPDAFRITRNTVVFNLLFIVLGTFVAVAFALMLYELSSGWVKFYQTIFFLPFFISWVVASYVFLGLLDMDYGLLNKILALLGTEPMLWYNEPKFWPYILVFASIWKGAGYSTIIYYTALVGIDSEYFDASKIDGASKFQQMRHISIPLIRPLIIMLMLLSIGRIFYSDFGLFYNVTLDSKTLYSVTDVMDTYVFRALRSTGEIGLASAAGFYQSMVGFVLVFLSNLFVRRVNPENSLF